jgi:limonene 1,2-monooxygenase
MGTTQQPERMSFGIFMAPFHKVGENPTLALRRDIELIEWMDHLGYDEAWIGEHHSAGWEIIADPAPMIAAVAERTKRIRLGSGVVSLPYHHPLMVANRYVQLDHMTRGRVMLGVGPGALVSDAYMMGIDPVTQRPRMDESLGVIMRLLAGETVDHKSDWFELHKAHLQLLPFTKPHFPIAVASQISPAGMVSAGNYGVGVLSLGAGLPGGKAALPGHWAIAEEAAAKHGKTVRRDEWRLVIPIHIADSREEALNDVREGQRAWNVTYFEETLGRPPTGVTLDQVVEADGMIIGSPDDAIASIQRLQEASGGFGGLLGIAHEWASREKTMRSYELFARYVMPQFQNVLPPIQASREFVAANRSEIFTPSLTAIANAFQEAGRELPQELVARGVHRPT